MLTKQDLSNFLRHNVNCRVIKALEHNEVPWQKPWQGHGKGVGFPRDIVSKKKYFGINVILLQMASKEKGFASCWWGTSEQFASIGMKVKNRPDDVTPGNWGTEIIYYKTEKDDVSPVSSVVYNLEQVHGNEIMLPDPVMKPDYKLADQALHVTDAVITFNENKEAWYFYPPQDYITIPGKVDFEAGLGGLPGYYESLAHELMHWTEPRLNYEVLEESIRELRAEIGSALLVEELGVPHSIAFSNFDKWREAWIFAMKQDVTLIFQVCASACKAVDYILAFGRNVEKRFNEINESAA